MGVTTINLVAENIQSFCRVAVLLLSLVVGISTASAEEAEPPFLSDYNGDGSIRIIALGDSITFGVGDGTEPGEFIEEAPSTDGGSGYPARLETILGMLVDNEGIPGEELIVGGFSRTPTFLANSSADIVIFFEGSNDALNQRDPIGFRRAYQRMLNTSRALGKVSILVTITPTCCDRAGRTPFINALNNAIFDLAGSNGVRVADVARAYRTTCGDIEQCPLLSLPEGLHPNSVGYDAISQTILATFAGIDIFSPAGAQELETAFNLLPGSVVVSPDSANAPQISEGVP